MMEFANNKSRLIDAVINQIKLDIANGDVTALEELLVFLDNDKLQAYLPEVEYVEIIEGDGFYCGE